MPAIKVSPAPTVLHQDKCRTADSRDNRTYSTALDPSALKAGRSTYRRLGNSRAEAPDSPQVHSNNDALEVKGV